MREQNNSKTVKISLLGNSKVGKTCFIKKIFKNEFTSHYERTIGMEVHSKIFKKTEIIIFDYIGGPGDFRPMSRTYFHSDAILLFFDVTDEISFFKLEFWIDLINKYANEETKVFLIGNKSDLMDQCKIEMQSIEEMSSKHSINFIGFLSSKTGENINETFETVLNIIIFQNEKENEPNDY